jgi:hypothetical protein
MEQGYSRLLNLLWRVGHLAGHTFEAVCGERVEIVSCGEEENDNGVWFAAEVVVDGERRRGDVVVGNGMSERAVLRVVSGNQQPMLDFAGHLVPQISYPIEFDLVERYDELVAGAPEMNCAETVASIEPMYRTDLYTKLSVNRLARKCDDVMRIFEASGKDWNQCFYVMLLRAMGGNSNRDTFEKLASKVSYTVISREKSSPERVEALLLGGSGFLYSVGERDDYTAKLESEFRHLAGKHSIVPLKPAEWNLSRLYPRNHPTVRLAEIAALLAKSDFLFDTMLACRTVGDVEQLFGAEASEYWTTHYKPGASSKPSAKRIGRAKTHLIGINLVAPLMFTYGRQTGGESLCERAIDLLETIPAEKNTKIDGWAERGCVPESGFESQALLELTNEFCTPARCADCYIGRGEIKKVLNRFKIEV